MSEVSPAERLINLLVALQSSKGGMTRGQIERVVNGYEPAGRADDARARMFERDKDVLRKLGVPLQATVPPEGNPNDPIYRIDTDPQALLPDVELTPAEANLLPVIVNFWGSGTLSRYAKQAANKLAASTEPGEYPATPFASYINHVSDNALDLVDAIENRNVVKFTYSSASTGTRKRTVEPWKIFLNHGATYLVGYDRDRQASRTFRLSRVIGSISVNQAEVFDRPADMPELIFSASETHTAVLGIKPGHAHLLRQHCRDLEQTVDGLELWEIVYVHEDYLLQEIASHHGAVLVIEPLDVRERVLARAQAAAEVFGG